MPRFRIRTTVDKVFDIVVEAEDAEKARELATTTTIKRVSTFIEVTPMTDDVPLGDVAS